jgi:hypothetical protein
MPAANQLAGYIFLVIFLAFVIGMLVNSLLLERKARRAEGFEEYPEERSTFFVNMPTMPQQAGVTDHDYWVKKNRSGG